VRQQRSHGGSFVAQNAAALVSDAVGRDKLGIDVEADAVLLMAARLGKLNRASAFSLALSAGRK
jgi:hypothetical protein